MSNDEFFRWLVDTVRHEDFPLTGAMLSENGVCSMEVSIHVKSAQADIVSLRGLDMN